MRPSIERLKQHRFFMKNNPTDYWQQIAGKTFGGGEVPYKPNPLKYSYLLQNEYPITSNIVNNTTRTMAEGSHMKQKSQSSLSSLAHVTLT